MYQNYVNLRGRVRRRKGGRDGTREREYEYDNEPKRGFWIMATDVATERDIGHMVRTWQKNNLKMP